MLTLILIPTFDDNWVWLQHDGQKALVVDVDDAASVQRVLHTHRLLVHTILVTYHHSDHIGGVNSLRDATGAKVYSPASEKIPTPYTALHAGEQVNTLGLIFQVIVVPGHTGGHFACYSASRLLASPPAPNIDKKPLLFCGNTLLCERCGRLFEGPRRQMLASLDKLADLPGNTVVCATREYTRSNLRFARVVGPDNQAVADHQTDCKKLREQYRPTLPTSTAQELLTNPFLRTRRPALVSSVRHFDAAAQDNVSVCAATRRWKNQFK